jgi:hypothetical protein
MKGWTAPPVERGIPIPAPSKPRKGRPPNTHPPSPWIAWLKTLAVGDSFPVYFSTGNTVKKYLENLGIAYEYRWVGDGQGGRFWILSQPWRCAERPDGLHQWEPKPLEGLNHFRCSACGVPGVLDIPAKRIVPTLPSEEPAPLTERPASTDSAA